MLELLTSPEIWMSLATLTFLEIILGVDNVIFVALMASRLPEEKRAGARTLGLAMALIFRVIMLFGLVWLAHLEADLFAVFEHGVSWRDLILLGGGLFRRGCFFVVVAFPADAAPGGRRGLGGLGTCRARSGLRCAVRWHFGLGVGGAQARP